MIVLIVVIGLLNVGLGFALAVFYGYALPGLNGLIESIGPMPSTVSSPTSVVSSQHQKAYDISGGAEPTSDSLAEEKVLGDVRDLTAAARTAVSGGPVESH